MAIIKLVTNGDKSETFKAISLAHAVTIFFGLVSIIGALGTWNLAITWDRSMLISMIREEMAITIKADSTATTLAISQLDGRLHLLEEQVHQNENQIIKNTERLDHIAEAWRK
jgi:hypothetical protein